MGQSYYNEIDPYAAAWLRNLISAGHIAAGEVDERDIREVSPADLHGFAQCHFFAGIGGWSHAARLAGWPDDRPLWTGSCPCQPFSVAGKGEGQADARHLWPEFFRLIGACRPDVVMGEQVAAAVGKHWLDGVCADLESVGYACGAVVVPACAVDAPHRRDRLWFVADANEDRLRARAIDELYYPEHHAQPCGAASSLADADQPGPQGRQLHPERRDQRSPWANGVGAIGADGKARRVDPGIRLLAYGVPARVGKLRAYGNAIVPSLAAEVIGAYLDTEKAAA